MGKIISFKSVIPQSGKTTSIYNLSCNILNNDKNKKVLVLCLNNDYSELKRIILQEQNIKIEGEIALNNLVVYKDEESYFDLLKLIPNENGLYLSTLDISHSIIYNSNMESLYVDFLKHVKSIFDYVFIEIPYLNSEYLSNSLNELIIENSDISLTMLIQDYTSVDKTVNLAMKTDLFVLGKYMPDIYPDLKKIKKLLKKDNVIALNFCTQLVNNRNQCILKHYYMEETVFNQDIKELLRFIGEEIEEEKKEGIINRIIKRKRKEGDQ